MARIYFPLERTSKPHDLRDDICIMQLCDRGSGMTVAASAETLRSRKDWLPLVLSKGRSGIDQMDSFAQKLPRG